MRGKSFGGIIIRRGILLRGKSPKVSFHEMGGIFRGQVLAVSRRRNTQATRRSRVTDPLTDIVPSSVKNIIKLMCPLPDSPG